MKGEGGPATGREGVKGESAKRNNGDSCYCTEFLYNDSMVVQLVSEEDIL